MAGPKIPVSVSRLVYNGEDRSLSPTGGGKLRGYRKSVFGMSLTLHDFLVWPSNTALMVASKRHETSRVIPVIPVGVNTGPRCSHRFNINMQHTSSTQRIVSGVLPKSQQYFKDLYSNFEPSTFK
jgi:hypothetical protein